MAAIRTERVGRAWIVELVPTDRPASIAEIANIAGTSASTARRALIDAADRIELECYERDHGRGPKMLYFRRYVEGETRPLYQPKPGVDAKALAACLGGYTYNIGERHGIRQ